MLPLPSFPIQHERHDAKPPTIIQGLIGDHFMRLEDGGSLPLVVDGELGSELGNPRLVAPRVELWMEIDLEKGAFVVALAVVGECIEVHVGL